MNWYRNTLMVGPSMALCRSPAELDKVCKKLKLKHYHPFLTKGTGAETRIIEYQGRVVCVVCIGSTKGYSKHAVNALLCHEAVHVWQAHCDDIGEKQPGLEEEAYAIQKIAQNLMEEFWDYKP